MAIMTGAEQDTALLKATLLTCFAFGVKCPHCGSVEDLCTSNQYKVGCAVGVECDGLGTAECEACGGTFEVVRGKL